MKFKPYEQHQLSLLPPSIDELISKDHFVRFLNRMVKQLDFTELYNSYSEEGNPAYHPKMLIKILIYAYSIGERSSRQIESRLKSDIYFMYLSGGQKPNFRTISDFRKDKGKYCLKYFPLSFLKSLIVLKFGFCPPLKYIKYISLFSLDSICRELLSPIEYA